ncbi:LysE family translocator [Vibrio sp. CDRSL-10 TSBA]
MEYILSVVLFAISSSVTPGPNNIMVMTSGLNFGVRRSLPLLGGICLGFALMLLMVGLGFAQLFSLFPSLSMLVKVVGTLYLLYLAWLIAISRDVGQSSSHTQPFGFIKGALFQWVNAKAWVVAIGAISAFTTVGEQFALQKPDHSHDLSYCLISMRRGLAAVWLAAETLPVRQPIFTWL